jgi:dienelactone hydrolase
MRTLSLLLLVLPLAAQDARNTDLPGTDTTFKMPEYRTLAEWQARRAQLQKQILSSAGLLPMPAKTPLHPQIFGRIAKSDYSVEKVLIETMPGYWLGGNLYRPVGKSGKLPAIASPHGHWIYGRLEDSNLGSIPARCINLARLGFVVLAYDMVGYNDTVQTPHDFGSPRHQLWGFGPLGLQLWNSIRVLDFLESLPEVDPKRIGATGASGGGTQTFLLAAVDDRVAYSAPVNMISSIMQGGSPCENAPNLRVGANNMEIGAMMAPRPMIMVAATGDWTKNTPTVEYPAVRSIYRLYDAESKLESVQFDAPHNYNQQSREAVYRFFAKRVLDRADADSIRERNYTREKLQDMLALHNRTLPAGALTFDQLFAQWVRTAEGQNASADRERLALSLKCEWPAKVASQDAGGRIALTRDGKGDRIPATWRKGEGPATLLVMSEGAPSDLASYGKSVLAIDAFQTGSAVSPRKTDARHFLTFNQSDAANRVQDILTAAAFLKSQGATAVTLKCTGKAAVWCTFAAAVAPVQLKLDAPVSGFTGTDAEFERDFFVPGIQRAGGWKAAVALARASR